MNWQIANELEREAGWLCCPLPPSQSLVDLCQDVPLIGNSDDMFWMSIRAGEIFVRDRQKPPPPCRPDLLTSAAFDITAAMVSAYGRPSLPAGLGR